jgi:hypothetical protein
LGDRKKYAGEMATLTEGLIAFVSPQGRDEAEPLRSQLPSALHDLLLQPPGSLGFSRTTELIGDQGLDGLAESAPNLVSEEHLGLDASSFGARWAAIGVPVFTDVELEAFTDGWETVEDPELRDRLGRRGWWEMLRTTDGQWALVPQDRDPTQTVVALTLVLGVDDDVIFERMTILDLQSPASPRLEPDQQCALDGKRQEPNYPYVGSCRRRSCTGGCVPITGTASGGNKVLLGCDC